MYFNWSVLIPANAGRADTPVLPGMEAHAKLPAELYFHPAGYSYAQPGRKLFVDSVQLAPHDYPASGWYGFNDAYGTLKSFGKGTVSNHTQRRIMAFLAWATTALPIDADRVTAVGADGAVALALNYPDTFASVRVTGFDRSSVLDPKAERRYQGIWGPSSPDIRDDHGRGSWSWAHLDELARAQRKDLPLFACLGASWGRDKGYAKGDGRFYRAMQEARRPLVACWGWNGARNLGTASKYSQVWRGHLLTRTTPVPAIWDPAWNHGGEQSGSAAGGVADWKDLVDGPDRFSVTIVGGRGKFNLTLRRLQRFRPDPGTPLKWEATSLPGRGKTTPGSQSGTVKVDEKGLVHVEGLEFAEGIGGLMLTVSRIVELRNVDANAQPAGGTGRAFAAPKRLRPRRREGAR